MADQKGEHPDFEELKVSGGEGEEPAAEAAHEPPAEEPVEAVVEGDAEESPQAAEEIVAEQPEGEVAEEVAEVEGEELKAEEEPSAGELEDEEGEEGEKETPPAKWPRYLEWAALVCIPLALLAFGYYEVILFATAVYVIAVALIPWGIWKGRETNTVYTVVLGCTLAAILTAIYCLWLEVGRYQYDVKAQDAKQRVSMRLPKSIGQPPSLPA